MSHIYHHFTNDRTCTITIQYMYASLCVLVSVWYECICGRSVCFKSLWVFPIICSDGPTSKWKCTIYTTSSHSVFWISFLMFTSNVWWIHALTTTTRFVRGYGEDYIYENISQHVLFILQIFLSVFTHCKNLFFC